MEMRLQQVFHLASGRTVFVGELPASLRFIGRCRAELWVAGELRQSFYLEGECLVGVRTLPPPNPSLRAVATAAIVPLAKESAAPGDGVLRLLPEELDPTPIARPARRRRRIAD